jgi:glyoxylase-like metal-dependent hydrolase (beta-lactamase superfamily II)
MQGVFHKALPWLAALLFAGAAGAGEPDAALRPRALAPGVFAFVGSAAAADTHNRGMVGNQGVIVGSEGVVVVGTGTSDAHGERLLQAIARLTDKPVVLAILAHAAPEHVLGSSAFARRGIPLLAHRDTDRYMAANCERCIRNLTEAAGSAAMQGSRLERPSRLIEAGTTLEAAGRSLDILHFGATQQPGAFAVFDRASGVLFGGGLASFDVLPDAHDADIETWLAALRELKRLPLAAVLPGRGPPGAPQRLDEVADYLQGLATQTLRAYRAGLPLQAAAGAAPLPRFASWALYETQHPRNVHHQYLRLEAQELAR